MFYVEKKQSKIITVFIYTHVEILTFDIKLNFSKIYIMLNVHCAYNRDNICAQ